MSVLRVPHIGPHSGIRTPNKAFTGGAGAGYSAAVLADSPLLYWRLGEPSGTTAADSSGNAHPGTYGAGVTLGVTGALPSDPTNTAAGFNDTSTAVVTSAFAPFVAGSQRTFEAWVNRTNTNANDDIWSGSGANPAVLECDPSTTGVSFYVNGATPVNWAGAVAVGAYAHTVLTYDDTTKVAELFVNGVSQGTKTSSVNYGATPGNFQAGRAAASFMLGSLDEIAIYSGLLSAARIAAHYAAR